MSEDKKLPEWHDKDEFIFKLAKSVVDEKGGKHDEFSLREPTYDELEKAENAATINKVLDQKLMVAHLIASISNKTLQTVKNLPIRRFTEMTEYLTRFM